MDRLEFLQLPPTMTDPKGILLFAAEDRFNRGGAARSRVDVFKDLSALSS
jgi:hypothetical protein